MSSSANQKAIFSKILVAIDSSDASMDAADHATGMSQRYNAELYAIGEVTLSSLLDRISGR